MKDILKTEIKAINSALSNYLESESKKNLQFNIDCSKLNNKFINEDIRHSEEFKAIFDKLIEIQNCPCLYIFEIESDTTTNEIIERLKNFGANTEKVIPKLKKIIPENSKTLYVGKVNKMLWGRLITHLGYHTLKNKGNRKTSINHGLQLHYWAKELSLQLKFIVIPFEEDMKDILPVLEKKLANNLKPIIGKHL